MLRWVIVLILLGQLILDVGYAAPEVSIGDKVDYGKFKSEELRETITYSLGGVRHCYQDAIDGDGAQPGQIVVQFSIQVEGTVSGIQTLDNSTGSADLETCLLEIIQDMYFDVDLLSQQVTITLPYDFHPFQQGLEIEGSGTFYGGVGYLHVGGSYKAEEISPSYGAALELGNPSGIHNLVLQIYGAEAKQAASNQQHRLDSLEEDISIGQISVLYRFCETYYVRLCGGSGLSLMRLSQSFVVGASLEKDEILLGSVPLQFSVSYSWLDQERDDGKISYGHVLSFGVDVLKTHGIDLSLISLAYGFRFQSME